jgi:hypothetical protein
LSLLINTFDDLLYIINTHPEWRQRLVKALFPEIDISKALAELVESNRLMRAQLGNVEERLAQLDARQNRMETHQDRMETHLVHIDGRLTNVEADIVIIKKDVTILKGDVTTLKGYGYENNLNNKADSIFGYGLRRGRDGRNEISVQLDAAEQSGIISAEEYTQVLAADLLWSGRLKPSDESITLVVESSWFAEPNDIDRAVSRAAILRRIGLRVLPVVAARDWLSAIRELAQAEHVIMVDEFGLDKPSWEAALAADNR